MKPKDLVLVQWLDAATEDGWTSVDDVKPHKQLTLTTGFLLKETANIITLAHTYDPESDTCNGQMHIPKGMIKRQRVLWRYKGHRKAASGSSKKASTQSI
jgi:hypothetical protein